MPDQDQQQGRNPQTNNQLEITNRCRVCKISKPIDSFVKDRGRKNGIINKCKECHIKEYYKKRGYDPKEKLYKTEKDCTCKKCKQLLSIESFTLNNTFSSGRESTCKYCTAIRRIELRESKKIKIKEGCRICRDCKLEKPFEEFNRDKQYKYGRHTRCKKCHLIYMKTIVRPRKYKYPYDYYHSRMRSILQTFLEYTGRRKNRKTEEMLGYTKLQFMEKFPKIDSNITIDHTIPISWFTRDVPVNIVHSLENLELMSKSYNCSKSNYYCGEVSEHYYKIVYNWILPKYRDKLLVHDRELKTV